jgi:DNA-binding transcriptional LysR family regulator
MRLNQLNGLLAFWKVARHRGFTSAAAELEVSLSALSQAIPTLEARLGLRLLNRTIKQRQPHASGRGLSWRVAPALIDVLQAGEQVNALDGRPTGLLRINVARISTAIVMGPLLSGFLEAYPEVQVELATDEGFVDVVEPGFDAGVRMGESVQKDMVAVPIGGPITLAVVGSPVVPPVTSAMRP